MLRKLEMRKFMATAFTLSFAISFPLIIILMILNGASTEVILSLAASFVGPVTTVVIFYFSMRSNSQPINEQKKDIIEPFKNVANKTINIMDNVDNTMDEFKSKIDFESDNDKKESEIK